MREIEKKIITMIQIKKSMSLEASRIKFTEIEELLNHVADEPFGISTAEFINHPVLFTYISEYFYSDEKYYFISWLRIEEYFSTKKINLSLAKENSIKVEDALKECMWKVSPQSKANGTALLPIKIANAKFTRNLYLPNDESLIALFLKY